jgi:hypothetical protein
MECNIKRTLIILFLLLGVTACDENPFLYDKKSACEINYGQNGISIIVDKNNVLIKNNTQVYFGDLLSVSTADGIYSTIGRYFNSAETDNFINSLKNSKKIYLNWRKPMGSNAASPISTTIDVTDFPARFDGCIRSQRYQRE